MSKTYNHKEIEKKWQQKWAADKLYETKGDGDNYFLLVEYPYPSGNLHIGHWYAFAVPDIYARLLRMQGKNVLFPIGFDSFGLPAENAAIKHGLDPKEWTYKNIDTMTVQLESMGNSFDWNRKVVASDPDYYKWTQWLFQQLYEKDLAYKKKATVNWCESCKTVLANEQVVQGVCERCKNPVTQKALEQWFMKITDYAERLLSDLDDLKWPEEIKESQRNWIGKSEGAEIDFPLAGREEKVRVFTTRPDTLYGATYMVLAPEHELVSELKESIENWDEVEAYVAKTQSKTELERTEAKEKTGVELKGVKAINPGSNEEMPIYIADYVLASYGTGAIMAVPAHDERDFAFATAHEISITQVIVPEQTVGSVPPQHRDNVIEYVKKQLMPDVLNSPFCGEGLLANSGEFTGTDSIDARARITEHVGGTMTTKYKLRDWLVSRQRYWGCPIPIVYDPDGKAHAIPEEYLPWTLPEDVDFTPTGESPLASSKELKGRTERIFGKGWTSEYDTMDTFVDSSWYFLRYLDPKNEKEFSTLEKQKRWMPVNRYSGGAEHTTMHVLYSRFFYKALFDLGLVTHEEPYTERMNRGLILGPDGAKMSKSRGNVIDPGEHVERVGADTVKMYLAFIGPYNETGQYPWDLGGIAGTRRFLERVWKLKQKVADSEEEKGTALLLHQTIKKVGDDAAAFKFNTAISQLMILTNALEKLESVSRATYETLLILLAPFAPHLTEELWESLEHSESIHNEPWPTYDEVVLKAATVTIAVQVNGKTRDTFSTAPDISKEEAIAHAKTLPLVAKWIDGKEVMKEIYVQNRLVNIVVSG